MFTHQTHAHTHTHTLRHQQITMQTYANIHTLHALGRTQESVHTHTETHAHTSQPNMCAVVQPINISMVERVMMMSVLSKQTWCHAMLLLERQPV